MQRRSNNASMVGERETVLHHPAPQVGQQNIALRLPKLTSCTTMLNVAQHPLNPRNLHSSPPPGSHSLSSTSASTSASSSMQSMGMAGPPADYQRFSSPPAQPHLANSDYQRFTSPPAGANLAHAPPNLYANPTGPQAAQFGGVGQQQQHYAQQGQDMHPPWAQLAGVNDVTAQMSMQFGRSAVAAGQDYMNKNVCPMLSDARNPVWADIQFQVMRHLPVAHLLHSFNVSNKYVLLKLRLVIFPWRHVSTFSLLAWLHS